jgi:hypothetical protein
MCELLVPENPDVPDVNAKVAGGVAEEMRPQMLRQRPGEDARQQNVPGRSRGPNCHCREAYRLVHGGARILLFAD